MTRLLALIALALASCAPVRPSPEAPKPPAWNPPPGAAVLLVGSEPSWTVLLKDGGLSFNGDGRGAIVTSAVEREARHDGVVFRTAPPTAQFPVAVLATVRPHPCRLEAAGRTYPYTATVEIDYAGASPPALLRGCGAPETPSSSERP